jgi:hypothetical protein
VDVTALSFNSLENAFPILIAVPAGHGSFPRNAIEIHSAREVLVAIPWIMLCKYRTAGKAREYAY